MKLIAPALVALAVALSGCATILGLEHDDGDGGSTSTSEGGHVRRDGEAAPHDGGEPHADGAMAHADGARDAVGVRTEGGSRPDASLRDAGHDAGCDGSFCACSAGDAQFCADFDEPDPLAGFAVGLDGGSFDEAGVVSVTSTEALSPPHSLSSSIPQNNFGSLATVTHTVPANGATRFDLHFDLWLGACSTAVTGGTIASIEIAPSNNRTLILQGTGIDVGQNNSYADAPMAIALSKWTPVELMVDTTTGLETGTVGGTARTFTLRLPDAGAVGSSVGFSIGQSATPSGACTLYFDDVTFDALP